MLYARSPGWPAAQIQVSVAASAGLLPLPSGPSQLEDNLSDLRPRNHLYVSSGATNLPVSFVLDTTQLADGFHDLTAVAYEGSRVRTQTSVSRSVWIQNTPLTATLTALFAGTNVTPETPLQFAVSANSTNIARLELFSQAGGIDHRIQFHCPVAPPNPRWPRRVLPRPARAVSSRVVHGNDQYSDAALHRRQFLDQVQPAPPGRRDVRQHQVRLEACDAAQRRLGTAGLAANSRNTGWSSTIKTFLRDVDVSAKVRSGIQSKPIRAA